MPSLVHFKRIAIIRALGIARGEGFEVEDLSPAINIILGPNGSGKSTLSRVALKLLWPSTSSVEPMPTNAPWTVQGECELVSGEQARQWRVDVEAGHVSSTVDGHSELFVSGNVAMHARYRLAIDELLIDDSRLAGERDGQFAAEILRQAAGGIDLAAVAAQARFAEVPPKPMKLQQARRTADQVVEAARSTQEALQRQSRDLEDLRCRHGEAARRLAELRDLARARNVLTERAAHSTAQQVVDDFDETVKRLTGGEDTELELLERQSRDSVEAMGAHNETLDVVRARLRALNLTEEEVRVDLEELQVRLDDLRAAEQAERQASNRERESAVQLESAERALFGRRTLDGIAPLDAEALEAANELVKQAHECHASQANLNAYEANVAALPDRDPALPAVETLHRGIQALAWWLRVPSVALSPGTAPIPLFGTRIALAATVVLSSMLAFFVHWAFVAGAAGAVIVYVAVQVSAARSADTTRSAPDAGAVHRDTFTALKLAEPAEWSVAAVGEAVGTLVEQLQLRRAQDDADLAKSGLERLRINLEAGNDRLRETCTAFELRFGIRPADAGLNWIQLTVASIRDWQEASARHAVNAAEAAHLRQSLAVKRQECLRCIPTVRESEQADLPVSSATLEPKLRLLRERRQEARSLQKQLAELDQARAALDAKCRDAQATVEAVWARVGIAHGNRAELSGRLAARDRCETALRELAVTAKRLAEAEQVLGGGEAFLSLGISEIEARLEAEDELRERTKELEKRMTEITVLVDAASAGHELSVALEARSAANDALREQEEANADTAIGHTLLEWLRATAKDQLEPRVLSRASELLTRFTNGRLSLRVDAGAGARNAAHFLARNGAEGWRPVAKLSSGERVQLLMAVRVAFLEENETHVLPLMLDEVLGTSDDERAERIIDAIIEVARAGRQVFYFTAQVDEERKWKARLEGTGVTTNVIDLRSVRGMAEFRARPLPEAVVAREPVPAPVGMSHHDYGHQLHVPNVDPWDDDLEKLHLWHVIEDPLLLHRVLARDVERLGQLRRLIEGTGFAELGASQEAVFACALAMRAACEAWRVGRGKEVDADALRSAAISERFFDSLLAEARRCRGDGKLLMEALRCRAVGGWGETKSRELEDFLKENGFIVEEATLDESAMRERLFVTLEESGKAGLIAPATIDRLVAAVRLLG